MNKLFIVVLAVCLISVNSAVVKREADDLNTNLENIGKKFKDFAEEARVGLEKTFNPENIQKQFNEAAGTVSKWIDDIKKKPEEEKQ